MKTLGVPTPTREQLRIIGSAHIGVEIIRGAAGSGKTTTALLRLRNRADTFSARHRRLGIDGAVRALVLTYNRTLCGYIEAMAQEQAARGGRVSLEVETFAQWARRILNKPLIHGDRSSLVIALARSEGIQLPERYLLSEVEYVLGRFPKDAMASYLDIERTGRGVAPRVERPVREKILSVVAQYRAQVASNGALDWEDLAGAAAVAASQEYEIITAATQQSGTSKEERASKNERSRQAEPPSELDELTDWVIAHNFDAETVGKAFLRASEGTDPVGRSIAFAAILSKAIVSRRRRNRR